MRIINTFQLINPPTGICPLGFLVSVSEWWNFWAAFSPMRERIECEGKQVYREDRVGREAQKKDNYKWKCTTAKTVSSRGTERAWVGGWVGVYSIGPTWDWYYLLPSNLQTIKSHTLWVDLMTTMGIGGQSYTITTLHHDNKTTSHCFLTLHMTEED